MLKKLGIILLTLTALSFCVDIPVLNTSGEGSIEVAPDIVYLTLGVQRDGITAVEAQDVIKRDISNVLDALQAAGLDREFIKTSAYQLYPVYKPRKIEDESPLEIDKYRAYIQLTCEMSQIPMVGKILDEAVKSGVNKIEDISFSVKDKNPAQRDALKQATERAIEKAKLIAQTAGVELVKPLSINEAYSNYDQPRMYAMDMAKASNDLNLPSGKFTVKAKVDVSYQIRPLAIVTEPAVIPTPNPN